MNLNLDENYSSTTKLSQWWTQVKGNFSAVKNAIQAEETARQAADTALNTDLTNTINAKDSAVRELINHVIWARVEEDENLGERIDALSAEKDSLEGKLLAFAQAADENAVLHVRMSDKTGGTGGTRYLSLNGMELNKPFVLIADDLSAEQTVSSSDVQLFYYNDDVGYIVDGPSIEQGGKYLCILKAHCVSGAEPEDGALEVLAVFDCMRVINCDNADTKALKLKNGCDCRFGTVTDLQLSLPAELGENDSDSFYSRLGFDSGASAAVLDYPETDSLVFVGTDSYSGYLVPRPNMHYDINFNFNGANVVGTVSGHAINTDLGINEPVPIKGLPVGAKLKLGGYSWTIADKQRKAEFVTLYTVPFHEYVKFDSSNTNRWSDSDMRQWLNSDGAANAWFVPNGDSDTTPSYANKAGFMYTFTAAEKACISPAVHVLALNDALGGGTETVTDKVWLASAYEIGSVTALAKEEKYPASQTVFEIFNTQAKRAVINKIWMLRSINNRNNRGTTASVLVNGDIAGAPISYGAGVVPFVNVYANTLVEYDAAEQAYVLKKG